MKRPGYKTTELWVNLVVGLIDLATQLPIHDKALATIVGVGYAISRGVAKHGTSDIIPADFVVPDTTDHPTGR